MNLAKYYSRAQQNFSFSREQSSAFAKEIADDFNPLHDADAKKFCVPGDLLFSIALQQLGVSQTMKFEFCGMVNENHQLQVHESDAKNISFNDSEDKPYLRIERDGDISTDNDLVSTLTQRYVEFSGHTFPKILVPLMKQHQVMINPTRPLVIYESMSINLDHVNFTQPTLEITHTELTVNGKRGVAILQFCFKANGEIVGHGEKRMTLSGLRPYDSEIITGLIRIYDDSKQRFNSK
ncbi:MAG: DUF3581 family protein [Gammaproteobacteria bacterium]|nr:DUF3581 family protein [Gammaproteobacteria bacterium]